MKVTMMVDDIAVKPVLYYSDPDYELIFYDSGDSEINLGLSKELLDRLKEEILLVSKQSEVEV